MTSSSVRSLTLNGEWTLRYGRQGIAAADMAAPDIPPEFESVPAQVPGNVELDLIRAGRLPADLDRGNNIYRLRALEKNQWWYSRSFEAQRPAPGERCELAFEGVDTLATVWLNGHRVARLENMLIPHRVDVTDALRDGANEIVVGIDSPVLAAGRYPIPPGERTLDANWESLNIRKAPHGFGWDILPRAVSAGLWRGVSLETLPPVRFGEVYVATDTVDPRNRTARLWLTWDIVAPPHAETDDWTVALRVLDAGGATVFEKQAPVLCRHACDRTVVENVDSWWPRGFGAPALYILRLDLLDGEGRRLARRDVRTGFRTVRLERSEILDANGNGRFAFVVNGEEIFIKGTNWVPLDAFHSRDAARLGETLDLLCDMNCNMVRCWGGGVYEDQAFFDRCDEEGILVWQDFALACAFYPQTPEFYDKMRREAEAVIPRLRNHPSLALWSGNNEVDIFYHFFLPHVDPNEADKISREVLATACRQLDPWRDYLPSSPMVSPALFKAGVPHDRLPEDHLWGPRDDFKGAYYSSSRAKFVSEIGYECCPSRVSLERMLTPERLWPWQDNDEWITHAMRPLRRGRQFGHRVRVMADQIGVLFNPVPDELDDFIFASQFSQAEAFKFFIERFRMAKGERSGILWWNLRDGWPGFSGGLVDYYGVKKIAWHTVWRVQRDACVMIGEAETGAHPVVAVNDTPASADLDVRVADGGAALLEGAFTVPANGRLRLGSVPAADSPAFYTIRWTWKGQSFRNHYLAGPRPFNLAQCRAWYRAEGLLVSDES